MCQWISCCDCGANTRLLVFAATVVVEQIGILTRRSRVTREARALTTNQMLTISLNITLLQSLSMSTSIPNHNNLYPNIEIIY